MTHTEALRLVNEELAQWGRPRIELTEMESQRAFQSLRAYAVASGRPIEVAVRDTVRFQIQGEQLQRSN